MTADVSAPCRVAVRLGGAELDVALPTGVPVGALLPSLWDIAASHGVAPRPAPAVSAWRLHQPGRGPLDSSTTLSESGIRDGDVLILSPAPTPEPHVRTHDSADELARTMAGPVWTSEWSRTAALLIGVAATGLIGFMVVPGPFAAPRLLLAAAAAALASVLCTAVTRRTGDPMLIAAMVSGLVAVAALPATLTAAQSAHSTGVALGALGVIVLCVAGRMALATAGPAESWSAGRARRRHAHLVSAAAVAAALGVGFSAPGAGPPGWPRWAFTAAVAAALLLRIRTQPEAIARALLTASGVFSAAVTFTTIPGTHTLLSVGACAGGAAVAGWLGLRSPRPAPAGALRRCVDAAGLLVPAAVIPLAAWALGLYGSARGWSPW